MQGPLPGPRHPKMQATATDHPAVARRTKKPRRAKNNGVDPWGSLMAHTTADGSFRSNLSETLARWNHPGMPPSHRACGGCMRHLVRVTLGTAGQAVCEHTGGAGSCSRTRHKRNAFNTTVRRRALPGLAPLCVALVQLPLPEGSGPASGWGQSPVPGSASGREWHARRSVESGRGSPGTVSGGLPSVGASAARRKHPWDGVRWPGSGRRQAREAEASLGRCQAACPLPAPSAAAHHTHKIADADAATVTAVAAGLAG